MRILNQRPRAGSFTGHILPGKELRVLEAERAEKEKNTKLRYEYFPILVITCKLIIEPNAYWEKDAQQVALSIYEMYNKRYCDLNKEIRLLDKSYLNESVPH